MWFQTPATKTWEIHGTQALKDELPHTDLLTSKSLLGQMDAHVAALGLFGSSGTDPLSPREDI